MRLAILGITGGVGMELARQALDKGHPVVGVSRHPDAFALRHPQLTMKAGAAEDEASIVAALAGCEVAVSAVGSGGLLQARKPTTLYSRTARSILAAGKAHGFSRVVCVTAGGIVERADWPFVYRRIIHPMLRNMYGDMKRMEDAIRSAGVRFLFARPAALADGPRTGKYRTEVDVTPAGGRRIRRADVADYVLGRIEADDYRADAIGLAE
jgi:putative NADH-flavin reductase